MDVVYYETAKRLKEAGFPSPPNGFGTIWYSPAGKKIVFLYPEFPAWAMHEDGERKSVGVLNTDDLIPAYTTTDILRLLPDYYLFTNGLLFQVWRHNVALPQRSEHDNPAEAAAAVWLSQNEKK